MKVRGLLSVVWVCEVSCDDGRCRTCRLTTECRLQTTSSSTGLMFFVLASPQTQRAVSLFTASPASAGTQFTPLALAVAVALAVRLSCLLVDSHIHTF